MRIIVTSLRIIELGGAPAEHPRATGARRQGTVAGRGKSTNVLLELMVTSTYPYFYSCSVYFTGFRSRFRNLPDIIITQVFMMTPSLWFSPHPVPSCGRQRSRTEVGRETGRQRGVLYTMLEHGATRLHSLGSRQALQLSRHRLSGAVVLIKKGDLFVSL